MLDWDEHFEKKNKSQNLPERKYITCPHCKGTTKCDCTSCGALHHSQFGYEYYLKGIFKVCQGKGKILD